MHSAANSRVKMAKFSRYKCTGIEILSRTKSKSACLHRHGTREKSGILNINTRMGPMRIRHSSHDFGWQSSHSVDLAGWQAKMASIEIWIPWRNAHKPFFFNSNGRTGLTEHIFGEKSWGHRPFWDFFFKKPLYPIASLTKTGMLFG